MASSVVDVLSGFCGALQPPPAPAPDKIGWLRSEMLKTRVAHGYCSRHQAAEACPYANICEQCDNYVTTPEFIPALRDQAADITSLRDDATTRGWDSEAARHDRVLTSINAHIRRHEPDPSLDPTPKAG